MEIKKQNFFNIYMSTGSTLNDKDRNINSDLNEIHEFFRPIDRLFGDYESRRKLNQQEVLYRSDSFMGEEVRIPRSKLEEKRVNENNLILFTVIKDNSIYCVKHEWIDADNLDPDILEKYKVMDVVTQYILDPVKIYHNLDIDEVRFKSRCNLFLEKTEGKINDKVIEEFIQNYSIVKRFYARHRKHLRFNEDDKINFATEIKNDYYYDRKSEIVKDINDARELVKNSKIPKINEIMEDLDKEKIKNFERLSHIRIRLGKHEDGRFVLFLHPYESESNNPLEIPTRR